jgi:[protein-PII] uridylyltransferase
MRALRGHSRSARSSFPVSVRVDQEASDSYTIVEVGAADRVGLLFDLAGTFARLDMDVHSARVATYGPRVIDAFYLTERSGAKLTDPARLTELEQALIGALEKGSKPSTASGPNSRA